MTNKFQLSAGSAKLYPGQHDLKLISQRTILDDHSTGQYDYKAQVRGDQTKDQLTALAGSTKLDGPDKQYYRKQDNRA